MWKEGIEMAKTAYALEEAIESGDTGRIIELGELLAREVKDEVGSQAEAGGWYEEYDRATSAKAEIESSEATQPERDGETFCTIRWLRDDVLSAINRSADVSLAREGSHANEVEAIIDSVIDTIGDGLDESSTEHGWEVIYQLIPNEVIEKAKELDPLSAPGKEQLDLTTGQEGLGTSYRSAVLSALEGDGWKVRGNDAGDLFTLSYRSPQTDREFAVVLNMRGRDIDSPGDWIQAARDITMDDSVLWNGGTDRDNQKLVYHDLNRFKDGMRRNLPDVVRQAVVSVMPKGYDAQPACGTGTCGPTRMTI